MKKVIKPAFYDSFSCIAGDCSLTCCQEWKIAVDDDTYKDWKKLGLGADEGRPLSNYVKRKDHAGIITLDRNLKCPFLREDKLCQLVSELGEQVLSQTCTTFPREVHEFSDRVEMSMVACCPEVVDFLNRMESFSLTETCEEDRQVVEGTKAEALELEYHLLGIRAFLLQILESQGYSNERKLLMIFYILQDLYHREQEQEEVLAAYKAQGALAELSKAMDQIPGDLPEFIAENNELFLDLVDNYRKEGLYSRYLEDISVYAEELSEDYESEELLHNWETFEKEFASYSGLLQKYLQLEFFTDSLLPESDLEEMVAMVQWIAMEYAAIRHAIFLRWLLDGQKMLEYTTIRDYMVVISRMTGYDEEDIFEYLENSFEELIWQWGYFSLLTGNFPE